MRQRDKYKHENAIPPLPPLSEKEVSRQCVKVFKIFAWAIHVNRNNIGGFTDLHGHFVRYGVTGDTDFTGLFRESTGGLAGKKLGVEIKKSTFDPTRLSRKDREHFDRQLGVMNNINTCGGRAFWVRDSAELSHALTAILRGSRVILDGAGWPYLEI